MKINWQIIQIDQCIAEDRILTTSLKCLLISLISGFFFPPTFKSVRLHPNNVLMLIRNTNIH